MHLFAILGTVICFVPLAQTINLDIHAMYGVIPQLSALNIAPALELAIEEIHRLVDDHQYNNFSITLHSHITRCFVSMTASAVAAKEYYNGDGRVAAFVGPMCSSLMRGVAELSAVWSIPVISGLTASIEVSEKRYYSTLTRSTLILSEGYGLAVGTLATAFNWKTAAWLWLGTGYQVVQVSAGKERFDELGVTYREIIIQNFESTRLALENAILSARGRSYKTMVSAHVGCKRIKLWLVTIST